MHEVLHRNLDVVRSLDSRRFWLIAATLALAGMLVFRQTYITFIEPHYPTSFDQLGLLHKLYGIYYGTLADSTQSVFVRLWTALGQFMEMKGWVLPALGTILGLLFGPYRDVFVMANYFFLVFAGGVLLHLLRRRLGASLALAGLGLVLLSNSLYFWAGGLTDLRWDCAGLATFGVFFLTLWYFGVEGGPKAFALIVLAYALTVFTRSTSAVYGLCSLGAFGFVCTVAWAWTRRPEWRNRWFATLRIGLASSAVFLLFFIIHFHDITGYYIQLLLTPEDAIRLKEHGVDSKAGLPLYYAMSFWGHFSVMIIAGGVLIAGRLLIRLISGWSPCPGALPPNTSQFKSPLLIGGSFIAGTMIPLSVYSPSPVVIGTLTIPLAVTLITIAAAIRLPVRLRLPTLVAEVLQLATLAAGFGFFVIENMSHSPWPATMLNWARSAEALLSQIAGDYGEPGGSIQWLTVNDGLNGIALQVLLYETGRYDAVSRIDSDHVRLFALDMPAVRQRIADADAVVAYRDFPQTPPPYPSLASLREMQTEWQAILDRQFVLRAVARLPWATFGYYSRPVALAAATGPFGIGHDGPKKGLRNAWVWMNANAAEVTLRNFSDAEVPVTLEFDALPGPGIAALNVSMVCDNAGCAPQHLVREGAAPWHLRVPLKLQPGITAVRFTAAGQQAASTDPQPAAPLAGIGHLHLIWNDR